MTLHAFMSIRVRWKTRSWIYDLGEPTILFINFIGYFTLRAMNIRIFWKTKKIISSSNLKTASTLEILV